MNDHGERDARTLAALIGLGIANHVVMAGGRVVEPWQIERSLGLPVLAKVPGA